MSNMRKVESFPTPIGDVKVYRLADTDEFRVRRPVPMSTEYTDGYFTADKRDALDTARAMADDLTVKFT